MRQARRALNRQHLLWFAAPILFAVSACDTAMLGGTRENLAACSNRGALCGHVQRPLDPTGRVSGAISIEFEFYPHTDATRPATGTIVATEGGPGFPTTGSRRRYLGLFSPLRSGYDLLLVDNRGTGRSQPIDCRTLQTMPVPNTEAVGACGASLGGRASLYGSGLAADDLAAVLDAIGIAKIDLYGNSYGSFFAQVFAARHPDRLHSLVLDGAFSVTGASPFYPNTPAAIRRNLDLVCDRSPSCRDHPGTVLRLVERLLRALRTEPLHGRTRIGNDEPVDITVDPATIGTVLYNAAYGPANHREFAASARAFLDQADEAPLLRLVAENLASTDSRDATGNPASYSYGLFAAVSCMDYPQLYAMDAPLATRRAQRDAALAAAVRGTPGLYAPLTIDEWLRLPIDYSVLDLCLEWPTPTPPYPPGEPVPPGAAFAAVPTLVISGELDTVTPPDDAAAIASLFPRARHLVLANSFHVNALGDRDDCASVIVRRFVATLDPGDVSCIARIHEVRSVPSFARSAAEAAPARPADEAGGSLHDLALAAAAAQTVGDVLARDVPRGDGSGVGLRGGAFVFTRQGNVARFELRDVRWCTDLGVSGTVEWNLPTGEISGALSLSGSALTDGAVRVRWNDRQALAEASIEGEIDGRPVHATMPAP